MFFMFLCIIIYIIKTVAFDGSNISSNSYNPRLNYAQSDVKRGDIKDINLNVLAESVKNSDEVYVRNYVYGSSASHIIGYTGVGKTGIEAVENFTLQNVENEFVQRLKHIIFKDEIKADSVVLTIDKRLQTASEEALGRNKGAVVIMEPSTGKILASASYPNFDPNNVSSDWDNLKNNDESPLLNRAFQGLYAPGSTFKIVTALSAMENGFDLENFYYECKGEESFENKIIHCFDNTAHGKVDIYKAMEVSCNTFFSSLGEELGNEKLLKTALNVNLNTNIPFVLQSSNSSFELNKNSSESELVETAIGQGKTLVTPLYMACLVSAAANGGVMMKPYIIDHTEGYNGNIKNKKIPEKLNRIMSIENSKKIKDMLLNVVTDGTGKAAYIKGFEIAGKTGTAENPAGTAHSWFVGFAPYDNPEIAVSIVLENPIEGQKATIIAKKIFKAYLNLSE